MFLVSLGKQRISSSLSLHRFSSSSLKMVKAIRGVLLECDQAVKTIVIDLDNKLNFIIADLDESHLFIDRTKLEDVRRRLDDILEENTYRVEI
jgi:TFIIH basal transcription factor complex TTD-A subunit